MKQMNFVIYGGKELSLESILTMLGGIGMFLYGMKLMGNSLERAAGASMERILEKLTSNKAKGVGLGAGVTAIIQSSAATIIMVIGFLNAGIMSLANGVPVIMGANIGTTITAQILRLGDINGDNIFLMMLQPSSFAPLLIIISAFIILMTKKQTLKDRMSIFMGLGILFMGMTLMENSFAPLAESDEFGRIFTMFENPALGVMAGMAVTILLQSSSASVGVLQATASTGVVTFAMAAPIVIGANLGKCVTVILASVGVNKDAKRAVVIDVIMCMIGSAIFIAAIYAYQGTVGFDFWNESVKRGSVANFHTLFNIVVAVMFLPFINALIRMSKHIVKSRQTATRMDKELAILDKRFIETPGIALEQCKKVISLMFAASRENYELSTELINKFDYDKRARVEENESFLDKSETYMGEYIVKITERQLSARQNIFATELLHTIGDLERIGDHCINLAEAADAIYADHIRYSEESMEDLMHLNAAVINIMEACEEAYSEENLTVAMRVEALEETIDKIVDTLKANHVRRLREGRCTVERGISYVEMLTDIERISDHCNNISTHLKQRIEDKDFNTHEGFHGDNESPEEFKALCRYYEARYLEPVKDSDEQMSFV